MSCLQQIFAPEIVFSNFSLEFGEFGKKKLVFVDNLFRTTLTLSFDGTTSAFGKSV